MVTSGEKGKFFLEHFCTNKPLFSRSKVQCFLFPFLFHQGNHALDWPCDYTVVTCFLLKCKDLKVT